VDICLLTMKNYGDGILNVVLQLSSEEGSKYTLRNVFRTKATELVSSVQYITRYTNSRKSIALSFHLVFKIDSVTQTITYSGDNIFEYSRKSKCTLNQRIVINPN
jgi:hypothetical protein